MGKNEVRFAVGSPGGPRSDDRRLWVNKNDVYMCHRGTGGMFKMSFHQSGICRWAMTEQYRRGEPGPGIKRWRRDPTPPGGSDVASGAISIVIPTDYLSTALGPPTKPVRWIPPAPPGDATVLELIFTNEARARIEELFAVGGRKHVFECIRLPRGDNVVLAWEHTGHDNQPIRVPARNEGSELLFSPRDPHNTGRPVRMEFCTKSGPNGIPMVFGEVGGHPIPPGSKFRPARVGVIAYRDVNEP
jgi:hypothetical protein